MRTKILQNPLIHFSAYFCAFLVLTDCIVKISDLWNKNNFQKKYGEWGSGGAKPPPKNNKI